MQKRRVILTDPEKIHYELLRLYLAPMNIEMDYSPQRLPAIEMCVTNQYDFVITNMGGGEMSGLEFIARIREILPDLPVVMLTAFPECKQEAIQSYGPRVYGLDKPYSREQAINVARQALECDADIR